MEKNLDVTNQFPQSLDASLNRGSTVVLLGSFRLNGQSLGFHLHTEKLGRT